MRRNVKEFKIALDNLTNLQIENQHEDTEVEDDEFICSDCGCICDMSESNELNGKEVCDDCYNK